MKVDGVSKGGAGGGKEEELGEEEGGQGELQDATISLDTDPNSKVQRPKKNYMYAFTLEKKCEYDVENCPIFHVRGIICGSVIVKRRGSWIVHTHTHTHRLVTSMTKILEHIV